MSPQTGAITVLLADDHALVREALGNWLTGTPDIEVVATASTAAEALEAAARHPPQVVLLDIDMPGLGAFDAARQLRRQFPETRVVFLSAFAHDRYIEQALAAEASGYVTKGDDPATIVQAIRKVAAGEAYFSEPISSRLVLDGEGVRLGGRLRSRTATLTARELEVLRQLAVGRSKKEAAQLLHLSERTVNRHCANLMAKLDIHDRVELAHFAIREGLIQA